MLSDAEIRDILVDRIDVQRRGVGIVVGVITPEGRRVIAHGLRAQEDTRPLDGDTVFETGSVAKAFTALLLADMVERGEVRLDDPLADYLPQRVRVPEQGGRKITLVDLATHTSGQPAWASNMPLPGDPGLADYGLDQLLEFLSGYALMRAPGAEWEYSNPGYALLGYALANAANSPYEAHVHARITGPLGMSSTATTPTTEMKARLASGHDENLQLAPYMDVPVLVAAGAGWLSTADDLLAFLGAALGYVGSPLAPAMAAMLEVSRPGPTILRAKQALGWRVYGEGEMGMVGIEGATIGFTSALAFSRTTREGAVVLFNARSVPNGLNSAAGLAAAVLTG